jgi:hypothetical protein
LTVFGPIVVCCIAYLRWQLGELELDAVAGEGFAAWRRPRRVRAQNGCEFYSDPARPTTTSRGHVRAAQRLAPELPRTPGVYVAAALDAEARGADAVIRGQLLADRIVNGRFSGRKGLRRGKKGALDVIVVGASVIGVSATLHLMHAGLRVLLVDRDAAGPGFDMRLQALLGGPRGDRQNARLPFFGGHRVGAVTERADGMLEVQAERAGWYTANVIFASLDSLPEASSTRRSDREEKHRAA